MGGAADGADVGKRRVPAEIARRLNSQLQKENPRRLHGSRRFLGLYSAMGASQCEAPFRQAEQEDEMDNLSIDRRDSEEGILNYQVSDEALEIAAAAPGQGVAFTIAYCTDRECPIGD